MLFINKSRLSFLFGLGAITQIRIIGAMGITEAACLMLSPFVLIKAWPKIRKTHAKTILVLLFMWFVSALITDMYRETDLNDALRGIFVLPVLGAVIIVSFALLWDDLTRVKWMALGILISWIISIYAFRSASMVGRAERMGTSVDNVMNFKTYYSGVVLLAVSVAAVFQYKRRPMFIAALFAFVSGVFLIEGSRGKFLILLTSAVGTYIAVKKYPLFRKLQRNILYLTITGLLGLALTMEIYTYSVNAGWMGEEELHKYRMQSDSEVGLVEGRSQFISAILAILDSPIIGHGSWAIDRVGYGTRMYEIIGDSVLENRYQQKLRQKDMWIPTHSHLWQAWVWHGMMGGMFWIFVMLLIIKYLRNAIHLVPDLFAYNILLLFTSMWAILFSPFANRPRWGILVCIVSLTLREFERRKKVSLGSTSMDKNAPWDGKWVL